MPDPTTRMSDSNADGPVRLDRNTLVPLGVAVSCLLMGIGFHTWLSTQLQLLDRRLERIEDRLETTALDRWRYTDMCLWVERLRNANPQMEVPDPVVLTPVPRPQRPPKAGGR